MKPMLKFAMQWLGRYSYQPTECIAIILIAACARITWATGHFYRMFECAGVCYEPFERYGFEAAELAKLQRFAGSGMAD